MVILTAALFVLIEALLYGRTASMTLLVGCGLALMLFAIFALQQRRRAQPIFDPVVFLRPAMVGIAVLLAAVSIGYWTVLVYLPPFLSASLGVSADTGGIVMLAATLPMLFVPPFGGRIVTALGWRWYFTLALVIMTIGSVGFVAALTANGTPNQWPVILAMIVVGLGAALAHPQLSGAVVALVPNEQAGMASAVTIVMRQAGFAVGIAAFGALLSSSDRAEAYFWPFVGAGLACVLGALAAMILLPPRLPGT
jgi:predicted MFS family arabinose efflux permease